MCNQGINPKKGGRFWLLRRQGGSYVPTDNQSTAEATILILHQQLASHMKGEVADAISLASMTSRSARWQRHRKS